MKKASAILFAFLLLISMAWAEEFKYIGSSFSMKYHRPQCEWAQKISKHNRVTFKGGKEAVAAGYAPCKVCRPSKKD
jgi:methylphosphotriester-DNA--protein-cysteine methyltransferase